MSNVRAHLKQTSQKFINSFMATILLATGLGGIAPLALTSTASAVTYQQTTLSGFNSVSWSADRQMPSSYSKVNDKLTMKVDNTVANTSSAAGAHFYQTEGFKSSTLPTGVNSVKASLYIDPAWENKPVRVGMWGVSQDTTSDPAWPIIEFVNQISNKYDYDPSAFSGIRVWDTNTGDWYNITASSGLWGKTVTLQLTVDAATHQYVFYVNDKAIPVKTYSTEGYDTLKNVVFDNYNSATADHADDYYVKWTNFSVGSYSPDFSGPTVQVTNPTEGAVVSNSRPLVISGTVTDPSSVLDVFARGYDSAVYPTRVINATAVLNGDNWSITIPAGTLQDGHHISLSVSARDALHNQTDLSPINFTVDNARPVATITSPVKATVNSNFDVTATITDANGIDLSSVLLQVEDLTANARAAKCTTGAPSVVSNSPTQVTLSCTLDTSGLQDGHTYDVWVWGTDTAGNSSSNITGQSMIPFTIDRSGPVVSLDNQLPAKIDGTNDLIITGVATDLSGVNRVALQINDKTDPSQSFNIKTHSFTNDAWSITVPANTLVDGHTYQFTFTGYDELNNHSTPQRYTTTVNNPTILNDLTQNPTGSGGDTSPAQTQTLAVAKPGSNGTFGQVLGASTTSSNTSTGTVATDDDNANTDNNNKSVKGAKTTIENADSKSSKNFLGLGWWWLLVLLAVVALGYGIARSRSQENN